MRAAALLLALSAAACSPRGEQTAPGPRPLHDQVAVQLRVAFDEAVDVPRFVVALSPT